MFKKVVEIDKVLGIAIILAMLSACVIRPDSDYIDYMDFRTLAMLFSLMLVMEGIRRTGFFDNVAKGMLSRAGSMRQLVLLLIMLCFFSSMVITNDVALITFVPLTIVVLDKLGREIKVKWMIPVIVMQTLAANLGSMLTPIGNPQNLYLSSRAGDGFMGFVLMMLPLTVVSFVMIVIWGIIKCRNAGGVISVSFADKLHISAANGSRLPIYMALFCICVLAVARVVDYRIVFGIVLIVTAVMDVKVLKHVDYSLIVTFAALFVFIGNLGRMESFSTFLGEVVGSNALVAAIAASQVISNVPAALLLSGFTNNYTALIIGTNIGGLGTMIASMASLISYKYVVRDEKKLCGSYMAYFTAVNFGFLAVMAAIVIVSGSLLPFV